MTGEQPAPGQAARRAYYAALAASPLREGREAAAWDAAAEVIAAPLREELEQWKARHEALAVHLDEAGVQLISARGDLDDARAEAASLRGPARPAVRLEGCPAHGDGQEHVQVSTGDQWLCVIGLRGLDDGWREMEADNARYRAALEMLRDGDYNPDVKDTFTIAREALEGGGDEH